MDEYTQLQDYVTQWMAPRNDLSASATRMASAACQVANIMLTHRPTPLKGESGRKLVQHALEHVASESRTVEANHDDDNEDNMLDNENTKISNIVEHEDKIGWRNKLIPTW